MNASINTGITDIKNFKNNYIKSDVSILNTDKINVEYIEKIYNNLLKSDSFANSDFNLQIKNYSDLFSFVKKVLYNEQFREIVINSNPVLKKAYENFINAITMDDSKLGEYIKEVLNDSNKFSGEFFDVLNKLLSETNDLSLKNSIYEFLKIFDYFYSQNENAFGVNSAFINILLSLPDDIKDIFLKLLADNSINKLDIFLMSAFNMNLPDKEKLRVILSYLQSFVRYEDNFKNDEPLSMFIPNTALSEDTIKYIETIVKTLKTTITELPNDIKLILDNLENVLTNERKTTSIENNQNCNIGVLQDLTKNLKVKASVINESLSDIIKFFQELKIYTSSNNKSTIDDVIEKLLLIKLTLSEEIATSSTLGEVKFENSSDFFIVFDSVRNNILTNETYSKEVKNQILALFDNLTNCIFEKLIFEDISKNKCELLLNLYEQEIIPFLLKNNSILNKNAMSALTHNLLRLKRGTASEFNKQVTSFFNYLKYNKVIDIEQSLDMKISLIKKIISKQDAPEGITSFLKLLDKGMKYSTNDQNRTVFENTLLSLISKNDVSALYKYFFIPIIYKDTHVLSEIFIDKEKTKDNNEETTPEDIEKTIFQITLILDIAEKGVFNTTLTYLDGEISAKIIVPDKFDKFSDTILKDITEIIKNNNLLPKDIVIANETNS